MSDEDDLSELEESGDEVDEEEDDAEGEEEGEEEQQEEEGKEEEEEEDKIPDNPLTDEHVKNSLSMLTRVGNGLSHAYITMSVTNSELSNIERASSLIHLRHVNFSFNNIKDLSPLSSLSHLLTIKADENLLTSINIEELHFLQIASFVRNKIVTLEGVTHPLLKKLFLSRNEIPRFVFPNPQRLSNLVMVDLSHNKVETLAGSFPPNLQELYLAGNLIASFGPIEGLGQLRVLHMRDNQLTHLDGISEAEMHSLTYLNVRGNSIEEVSGVSCLHSMTQIKALILQENPIYDADDYRVQILSALKAPKSLMRLDKDDVEFEELEEAEVLMKEVEEKRLEEEEQERKKREEEEEKGREEEQQPVR
ncbi:hypothetical protein CAPTEDRAFT_152161 [Capitella teleta]|uniref:U2A'/phosphoprotein 32 family A C-terminal domain-containing protein n=1 Tax=Capitella teleta TaxID=283909 RepID=R7TKM1_CAPTE|nr:hypothetical protein CAPTEDRAFT_152161 [Capitella teleta]|eukprot:ELT94333.1 hypothetical protein CAPTEDRAFT_152161 [Capitella teleta]